MNPFARIILSVIIVFFINLIFRIAQKENNKKSTLHDNGLMFVHYPKVFFCVSITTTVFFIILSVLMYLFPFDKVTPMWCYALCSLFILFSTIIALFFLIWRIEVHLDKDYFVYRTFRGKKYRIEYRDCLFYSLKDTGLTLKVDTNTGFKNKAKVFSIANYTINYDFFLKELNTHNVKKK